jgi:hypothetical protein
MLTVIDEVVWPVFQNSVPWATVDNVDEPQVFATVITGLAGVGFGAATPVPGVLVTPLTVCFTVYTPVLVTVIEEVVSPVLHRNDPVAVVDRVELPQLFTTVTSGGGTTGDSGMSKASLSKVNIVFE